MARRRQPRPPSRQSIINRIKELAWQIRNVRCCYHHMDITQVPLNKRTMWACDCKHHYTQGTEPVLRFPQTSEHTGCAEAISILGLVRDLEKLLRKRKAPSSSG